MIFDFWQEHLEEFASLLEKQDFSPQEIGRYKAMIERLIPQGKGGTWKSYDDASNYYRERTDRAKNTRHFYLSVINKLQAYQLNGELPVHRFCKGHFPESDHSKGTLNLLPAYGRLDEFISGYRDEGYLRDVRRILGLLANFHIHGLFPNNREVQNPLCLRASAYSVLNQEFKMLVDFGCEIEEKRGLKQSTIHKRRSEIGLLLYSLQIAGEDSLSKIPEYGVISFFYKGGEYLRGCTTASSIAIFLKDAMEYAPNDCSRVLSYVPKIRKGRKNIQYLTESESDAFCRALEDGQNGLSYKHRAIGTLLYYTGMRCSDICCLRLDSVDLQCSTIRFIQQKTGNSVEIPLSAIVGNALIDYCVYERPTTDSPYLFVTNRAPHRKLIRGTVQWTVAKVMEKAYIRQNKGDRKGGHIFRHQAVSRMAGENIPAPVISAMVGHVSPKSLNPYLYADMKHIRECALGLEKYPMSEEVFSCV